jgi:predicted nucleic acid-binding protein
LPSTQLSTFTHQKGLAFYLDTSALWPLALMPTGKIAGEESLRVGRLTTFVAKAQAVQSRVLSSILVVEELAALTRNRAQAALATANGHATWKDFKQMDPGKVATAQRSVQADVLGVLKLAAQEMKTYAITVEHPIVTDNLGSFLNAPQAGSRLRNAHQAFLKKYPTLDSMDAMHMTFGAELGCRHFVSFDNGWDGIAEIFRLY